MVRFPLARAVFNREKASGYYTTGPFFWAYFCVDIPMQVRQYPVNVQSKIC